MEDHTSDVSEGRIPFLDYKTYTDRNFFLPSKEGANDPMIPGRIQVTEGRRANVAQALNQFSNLLNSKTFLINVSFKLLLASLPATSPKLVLLVSSSSARWRVALTSTPGPGAISPPC